MNETTTPPRRMLQPAKDTLRWELELARAQAAFERARADEAEARVWRWVALSAAFGFALGLVLP